MKLSVVKSLIRYWGPLLIFCKPTVISNSILVYTNCHVIYKDDTVHRIVQWTCIPVVNRGIWRRGCLCPIHLRLTRFELEKPHVFKLLNSPNIHYSLSLNTVKREQYRGLL